jgi:hypothetical protein
MAKVHGLYRSLTVILLRAVRDVCCIGREKIGENRMSMKVKSIRITEKLYNDWKAKYNKNGDQRLRNLMLNDLKGAE